MAGDWIKVEHVTADKPEILAMAECLHLEQDAVFGKCLRLWIWADQQSHSCNAATVTKTFIDRITTVSGFADAMLAAGWLESKDGHFTFVNFERHNGQTAKDRALTNKRVTEDRLRKSNAMTVTKSLPEKRREEIKNPPTPQNQLFERFWAAYPRKTARQAALKAWNKLRPDPALLETILVALTQHAQSSQWTKDSGQFIPHPATWLNGQRWLDGITQEQTHGRGFSPEAAAQLERERRVRTTPTTVAPGRSPGDPGT